MATNWPQINLYWKLEQSQEWCFGIYFPNRSKAKELNSFKMEGMVWQERSGLGALTFESAINSFLNQRFLNQQSVHSKIHVVCIQKIGIPIMSLKTNVISVQEKSSYPTVPGFCWLPVRTRKKCISLQPWTLNLALEERSAFHWNTGHYPQWEVGAWQRCAKCSCGTWISPNYDAAQSSSFTESQTNNLICGEERIFPSGQTGKDHEGLEPLVVAWSGS